MKQCGIALQWGVTGSGALCIPKTEELLYELSLRWKVSIFPGVFLERVLDGAFHALSWQGAPTFKHSMARG